LQLFAYFAIQFERDAQREQFRKIPLKKYPCTGAQPQSQSLSQPQSQFRVAAAVTVAA